MILHGLCMAQDGDREQLNRMKFELIRSNLRTYNIEINRKFMLEVITLAWPSRSAGWHCITCYGLAQP